MQDLSPQAEARLTRLEISDAVSGLGWRFVLGVARTCVRVVSLQQAAEVAARAVAATGGDAGEHLSLDLRPGRVVLTLQTLAQGWITRRDVAAARQISAAVAGLGLATDPDVAAAEPRSVQVVWIAIDGMDIPAIRPFWKAVMGYADEPGASGPEDCLIDPVGQQPTIWFRQMDAPRPQRNRIHLDSRSPTMRRPAGSVVPWPPAARCGMTTRPRRSGCSQMQKAMKPA